MKIFSIFILRFFVFGCAFSIVWYGKKNLNPDLLYQDARKLIWNEKRGVGRIILAKVMEIYPEFGDVLILMRRAYTWDCKFNYSSIYFEKALVTSPAYEDVYLAYFDDLLWREN